jgi:hypothetical protein
MQDNAGENKTLLLLGSVEFFESKEIQSHFITLYEQQRNG